VEGNPHRQDQILKPAFAPDELTESFQPVIGAPVVLRALREDDLGIEREFVTGLSSETRHNRLLGGAIKVTDEYLRRLTHLDWSREAALAAITMLGGAETLIGVARYVGEPDGAACEFAIVLADAWQGRGVGRRLMEKLIALARSRGLASVYGDVLSSNRAMLEFSRRLGFTPSRHPDDPTLVRVTLELA